MVEETIATIAIMIGLFGIIFHKLEKLHGRFWCFLLHYAQSHPDFDPKKIK